ncbi:MAG: 2-amino-4-hydroxy-6-hydroxymethyldihydropteridine diphosphokinase [Calditrichaceae bacterium]|nr:2-amino-4-hydroxy-6-hydroxymethyldihydropteridine diphosphokinase [Calditrichaceae bacterium]MBN2709988.1 2-amino-4-hydroxy-6-hydroxymethyldihydropteridine diphosphokinase [Calditrichaceae bacterium]RQV97326.1 MAG: 2-amino-4-hydroxy-6-hydroxymethyldihydropteridine diphosphokinase [Calditrichota bacterium]
MIYYLALGSNLGDRFGTILNARDKLAQIGQIQACSSVYETEPFGISDQPPFLNAMLIFSFNRGPFRLLRKIKNIEIQSGRYKTIKWGSRVIDIDIIEYEDVPIDTPILKIPHNGLTKRNFLYYPLTELIPGFKLRSGEFLSELKSKASGRGWINLYRDKW